MVAAKNSKFAVLLVYLAGLLAFFYLTLVATERRERPWHPWGKTDSKILDLERVLKKAAMVDKTVILTTLNEAWAAPSSIIDLFLESFRIGEQTKGLLSHLVIVAMDQKALNRCQSIHIHCFSLTTTAVDFLAEKRFMSADFLKMMWRRTEFLLSVLELGYNFVFTDADVMWLRNPFQHLDKNIDITIASDHFVGNTSDLVNNRVNTGFAYVRSSPKSIEFYKYWHFTRILYPRKNDQSVFNYIKKHGVEILGLQMRFLDPTYFTGFCHKVNLGKVCTMHANCCVGIERKLYDLRLVLEDWRNYMALSLEEKKEGQHTWRAPSKCKESWVFRLHGNYTLSRPGK